MGRKGKKESSADGPKKGKNLQQNGRNRKRDSSADGPTQKKRNKATEHDATVPSTKKATEHDALIHAKIEWDGYASSAAKQDGLV